jgi:glycosyltransferase involved in cell wall biosynthesis
MTATRKVLMVVENLPVPPDPRVWAEATALRDRGFQVSIIGPRGFSQHREGYVCVDNIHIYRYSLPASANKAASYIAEYGVALVKTFWLSLRVLFRQGFDVIHAANPPDMFFTIGLFYRLFGKKFIFDQHDLSPEMFQSKFKGSMRLLHTLMLLLERCSYQTAHVVITANLIHKGFAIERDHCRPDKVFVVRNGPNLKRIKPVTPEPALKGGRRYLLAYVGLLEPQNGVEYALHALHDLVHKRGRQDVSLVIMGDGGQAGAMHALAHELRLDDYVNFTGWTQDEDIVRYLTVADIGLTPCPKNGKNEYSTPTKTMEYMAMGKPVVSFELAEARFSAQGASLYAVPNLAEDFANKIETLLDDQELRLRMGAIGRRRIEEGLSWEHNKQNLLLAYEMLFPGSSLRTEPLMPDAAANAATSQELAVSTSPE